MEVNNTNKKRQRSRGKQCAAAACNSFEYLNDGSRSNIRFFQFPAKVSLRTRWCNLIKRQHGRDGFYVKPSTVVCDKHFQQEDIYKPPGGTRHRLRPGAEPSIFEWSPQPKKKTRRVLTRRVLKSKENVSPKPQEQSVDIDIEEKKDLEESPSESAVNVCETDETDMPQVQEKSTQTDWSFDFPSSSKNNDHDYAFTFTQTPKYPCEYQQTMQERLEVKSEMLNSLRVKVGNLQKELDDYKEREFSLQKFKDDDSAIQFYTGFPNYDTLVHFFNYIEPKLEKMQYWGSGDVKDSQTYQEQGKKKPGPKRNITFINEFFMVLVRLKVGLFVRDLADRFNISMGHFSKIFCTWINFLYFELDQLFPFPSQSAVRRNMPEQFALYPTTRVIIDCTEIFVEVPSSMTAQSLTWSNYKHHNTFKALIGISPNGQVTFVSKLWGGRVSDKFITQQSGLIQFLNTGDNVMADRGFDIGDILPQGVHLNIPPYKGSRNQLTAEEVQETVHIASVRIHVERAIGRIKGYHILDGTLPLSLSHVANQIFTVCSYLTNFLPPLLPPKCI